jgi:multidrug efflux pump subunit AcrA (membrane-fusion protein)
MSAMRSPTKLPSPIAGAKRWAKDRSGRSSKRRSLPRGWHNWALGALCLLVVVLAITSVGSSSADSAAAQRTATVERGVVQSTVSGNGSLEAAQQAELDFGASGEVIEIDVEAGQKVSKGDVLARIDSSSARASLASAEAQLAEAEETLEAAEEGQEVSAVYEGGSSTVLASYESGPAATSATEGGEGAAESEPTEGGGAEKGGSGTKKPSKPGEETSEPSEGSGEKGKQEPAGSEQGGAKPEEPPSSTATEPSVEAAPGEAQSSSPTGGATVSVATAEAKLRQARLSVKSARQEVRETALRAPISGTIASVSGSVGETVSGEGSGATGGSGGESSSAGGIGGLGAVGGSSSSSSGGSGSSSAFIVLSQLGRLKMEVSFSESDIGRVKVGQSATVSVSSMEGTELAGRVTKVDVLPSEGSSSGVVEYPATITLTQSARGVRAGMSASAEVVVEQVGSALAVSSEAITSGPGGASVTVLEDGRGEAQRSVTTGLKGDETTQVLSGLKAGETVALPEITAAAGGEGAPSGFGEGGGGFPGGGSVPRFGVGGPPSGFPGAP